MVVFTNVPNLFSYRMLLLFRQSHPLPAKRWSQQQTHHQHSLPNMNNTSSTQQCKHPLPIKPKIPSHNMSQCISNSSVLTMGVLKAPMEQIWQTTLACCPALTKTNSITSSSKDNWPTTTNTTSTNWATTATYQEPFTIRLMGWWELGTEWLSPLGHQDPQNASMGRWRLVEDHHICQRNSRGWTNPCPQDGSGSWSRESMGSRVGAGTYTYTVHVGSSLPPGKSSKVFVKRTTWTMMLRILTSLPTAGTWKVATMQKPALRVHRLVRQTRDLPEGTTLQEALGVRAPTILDPAQGHFTTTALQVKVTWPKQLELGVWWPQPPATAAQTSTRLDPPIWVHPAVGLLGLIQGWRILQMSLH